MRAQLRQGIAEVPTCASLVITELEQDEAKTQHIETKKRSLTPAMSSSVLVLKYRSYCYSGLMRPKDQEMVAIENTVCDSQFPTTKGRP